jgi:RNA polymerase sigma-70 factor (ECF subfamily)
VQARRKRFEPADSAKTAELTEQFMTAASTGDVDGLMALLAPDATWTADSNGKATAARRPVVGARKVAAILSALFRVAAERMPDVRFETAVYNSSPSIVVYNGDQLEGVFLIEIVDGLISHFYAMRNPDKLLGIAVPREISRTV